MKKAFFHALDTFAWGCFGVLFFTCAALAQVDNPGVRQSGAVTVNAFATWAANGAIKSQSATQVFDTLFCSARGSVIYRGASSWVCLAPGSSGNVLTTGGAGADPSWTAVGGTGTVTSVGVASSGSSITVSGSPITGAGTINVDLATGAAASNVGALGGDLSGTLPNPALANVITAAGPIGSATVAPIITYDAKGRLTTVTSATITPAFGSLTGSAIYAQLPTLTQNQVYGRTAAGSGTSTSIGFGSIMLGVCGTAGSVFSINSGGTFSCVTPSNFDFIRKNGSGDIAGISAANATIFMGNTSATNPLSPTSVWSAAALSALTYSATITADFGTSANFSVTLTGNTTFASPSNAKPGQTGIIAITQDGTGSRTATYGANWKFAGGTAPTLTTAANATDFLTFFCTSASFCYASLVKDIK